MAAFELEDFLLIRKVDSYSEIRGIPIYVYDDRRMQCRVIRNNAQSFTSNIVLLVEIKVIKGILERTSFHLKELTKPLFNENTGALKPLYSELVSAGLSCSSTVGSMGVTAGSAAAGFETFGATWAITAVSWVNLTTSAALCGNDLGRLKIALGDAFKHKKVRDDIEELAMLDNSDAYTTTKNVVEVVNLAASLKSTAKYAFKKPLQASYTELKYIRKMKGAKRLEPLKTELEKFKFINTKKFEDTAQGIMAKKGMGVGNSEMDKLIKLRKAHLNQLNFKNLQKDFIKDFKGILVDKIKGAAPDIIKGVNNFLNEETTVVTFHFVEI